MARTTINEVFTKEDWEKYNEYAEAVKRDLSVSGLSKERQEEIFNVLAYNEQMRMAANRLGTEYNELNAQRNQLIDKYEVEPKDSKAKKIAGDIQKVTAKRNDVGQERNHFMKKFHETSARAVALDRELNDALIKQGYKIDARGRLRKSEGYRQSPTVKTRTRVTKSM